MKSNLKKVKDTSSDNKYESLLDEYMEFAYVVSHDLQAPVRQLEDLSKQLLDDLDTDLTPLQVSYKEMIEHVAQEANQTLDALLTFSRLNTDDKVFQDVDLNDIIEVALSRAASTNHNVIYETDFENLRSVHGDKRLLIDAFYYLLDNSLKFAKDDEKLDIKITEQKQNGNNIFCIEDNGVGIPKNRLDDVFIILRGLGSTGEGRRGVGLTFAKKIIEIHQGHMWIKSEENVGTKVFFSLNLQP